MTSAIETLDSLFSGYKSPEQGYDEMLDAKGMIRPPWSRFLERLGRLSSSDLQARDEMLRRIVHENGITYNVYLSDKSSVQRPWMVDLFPTLVEYSEWKWIEKALRQRMGLMNTILHDVYGEQRLLKKRSLPLSLVFNNPAFLYPCHGYRPPQDTYLHFYAADLARSPDGRWWVLSDRVETPSGIGYALENRFVTSSVLPEVFRNSGAMRLQPFFQMMRESFESLVQRKTEDPSIVMLSPGPANETYYEQSFLARNLGYPLVEGSDLMVRDHCVYLKTVSGMERVDVILRRVESRYCDPLELKGDSMLGIPGLVHAARMNNVVIANALGTGFLETPSLFAFLPGLCREVLGEDLLMPSVATWWCGQEREKSYVLENLRNLVVKPVFRSRFGEAVFGQLATEERLETLRREIKQNPEAWCAQEQVAQATTPVYRDGALHPRHFLLRVYLVAYKGEYHMMPGGLSRITSDLSSFSVSVQQGGQSQDAWMLTEKEVPTEDIPLPHTGPVHIQRQTSDLPSRVADNVHWFGRYLDRGEHLLRLVRMLSDQIVQEDHLFDASGIEPFLDLILSDSLYQNLFPEEESSSPELSELESTLAQQLWDDSAQSSLVCHLSGLTRTAYVIKERLSVDIWLALTKLQKLEQNAVARFRNDGTLSFQTLNEMLAILGSIHGGISENMTRAHDWYFLEIGRRVERAINLSALIQRVLVPASVNSRQMMNNLLVATDSSYTYRGRYLTNVQMAPLIDLLIADESNPRSVLYQIIQLRDTLKKLPRLDVEEPYSPIEKIGLRAYSRLRLADLEELSTPGEDGSHPSLHSLLEATITDVSNLSTLLGQSYFAHGQRGDLIKI